MYAKISNLTHEGSGDFTQDVFILKTLTSINALTYKMEGVAYFNKTNIEVKSDIEMDMVKSKYTFQENSFRINELVLGLDGWVEMPTDDIAMDLTYSAQETSFKSVLSLVPAVYATEFETIKTSGALQLDGYAKGIYAGENLPGFGLNLQIKDGFFQYPDLPKSVSDVQVDLKINSPGGDPDKTIVDLKTFHMKLGDNPIDAHLTTTTPVSDPNIDGGINAKIDLSTLTDVIPMEAGENYAGIIESDVNLKGALSSLENEQYDQFSATGTMTITALNYKSADVPYGVTINQSKFNFNPAYLELANLDMQIGKSDLQASGKINNYMAYYLRDDVLKGSFNMTSQFMNMDEFMEEEETTTTESEEQSIEEEPYEVIPIPSNINFEVTAAINKMVYDGMEMTNANGQMTIKDSEVLLDGFDMDMLGGSINIIGKYGTKNVKAPVIDFGMSIKDFDVVETYETFTSFQKMVPILEKSTGSFSTNMTMDLVLDDKMEPLLNTLNGGGKLITKNVVVENSGALGKLADQLKMEQYKTLILNDVNISFSFEDGKIIVEPFDIKTGNTTATVSGYNSFDQTMDYKMALSIPSSELGGGMSALAGGLGTLGNNLPKNILADVLITGSVTDPQVKVSLQNMLGSTKDNLKNVAKEKVEDLKKEAKKQVEDKVNEVKEDAQKKIQEQADKIRAEAQKQAQKIRDNAKKAADVVKKEGYANADKSEQEAENPISKVAAKETAKKMKAQADKKSQKIIDEGNKKAQDLLDATEERIKQLQ